MVEALILIAVVGLVIFGATSLLLRSSGQAPQATPPGTWRVAHHDTDGETRVVLQKVRDGDTRVLDEHVVASIRTDDPDYDDKYLAAMDAARQRQALFEAEGGG